MRWRHWFKEGLLALLLLGALLALFDWLRAPAAEDLSELQLTTTSGDTVSLSRLSEPQPLLIYYWASWCSVCRTTGSMVESLHQEGIPVLGVALQSGSDHKVADHQQRQGYHFASVNDQDGALARRLGIQVTPTFLIVNKGKVVGSTTGWSSQASLKLRLRLGRD